MMFDENSIVRYLLGEMDPSEQKLFEERMQEDENLLIDVESLRTVYRRISTLEPVDPPKQISRKVLLQASHHLTMKKRRKQRSIWMSAAATLLILFVGGTWLLGDSSSDPNSLGEVSIEAGSGALEATMVQTEEASSGTAEMTGSVETVSGVTPWVDQNEELHFLDRYDQQKADRFDSLLYQSMDRLQPLQKRAVETPEPTGGLHMTGQ